jgi:DNA-binding response OmpR family regulator
MRLLVVEDNPRLGEILTEALGKHGFAVDCAASLEAARLALQAANFDIVVLDLGLPDGDGMKLLAQLRDRNDGPPVLILTAREGAKPLVSALNEGADDYLRKPFDLDELVARLRALLRRPTFALASIMQEENLVFNTSLREVRVDGEILELGRREIDALEILLRRFGRVVPKQTLEEGLYAFDAELASNAVEVLIHRLRRRLQHSAAKVYVHTVRGVGYMLCNVATTN